MGNRAVITTRQKEIGVYLHWNGGRESVESFLAYCRIKGYRSPDGDCYGWARLCQVIGNYLGGTLSVGIDRYSNLEGAAKGDNGVYVIRSWGIVSREETYEADIASDEYVSDHYGEVLDRVIEINDAMPKGEQLEHDDVVLQFNALWYGEEGTL